jgi:hypothetical protein
LLQFKLDTMLEELEGVKMERAKEPKLWQANFDYVRARLAVQIAYVYEYNAQLGQMRKGVLGLDRNNQTGWQLVPNATIMDRDAAKYARKARTLLETLARDNPGGDWERIGQQEAAVAEAGLQWKATGK